MAERTTYASQLALIDSVPQGKTFDVASSPIKLNNGWIPLGQVFALPFEGTSVYHQLQLELSTKEERRVFTAVEEDVDTRHARVKYRSEVSTKTGKRGNSSINIWGDAARALAGYNRDGTLERVVLDIVDITAEQAYFASNRVEGPERPSFTKVIEVTAPFTSGADIITIKRTIPSAAGKLTAKVTVPLTAHGFAEHLSRRVITGGDDANTTSDSRNVEPPPKKAKASTIFRRYPVGLKVR